MHATRHDSRCGAWLVRCFMIRDHLSMTLEESEFQSFLQFSSSHATVLRL
jgi:hypothetical protein